MNINEMNLRIEEEKQHIEQLLTEMEAMIPRILNAVTEDVVEWSRAAARKAAEAYVVSRPQQHVELTAKVPALKAAIDRMLVRLPTLVEKELDRLGSWPHRTRPTTSPWTLQEGAHSWRNVTRRVYGFIAQPFAEYGFLSGDSPWHKDHENTGHYVHAFGGDVKEVPPKVRGALEAYRMKWDDLTKSRAALHRLEAERAKAAFSDAWDK